MRKIFPFTVKFGVLTFLATFSVATRAQDVSTAPPTETSRKMEAVAASDAQVGVKRAFLVGVDDYAEFADLKYAGADVEALRAQLLKLDFKPDDVVALTSTSKARFLPTRRNVERQLDAFLADAGPDDLLFLHFSGHGFQAENDVLFAPLDTVATNDENVLDPETTISLTELVERLEAAKATRKILVVDACRENPTESRNVAASALTLKTVDARPGVLVLQSCSAGELSREDAQAGRGLFTGRLLEALEGRADADGDATLSALEICRYASKQTATASRIRYNAPQNPRFNGDAADFIVADVPQKAEAVDVDLERAEALSAAALESAREKKFDEAKAQIASALEIVVDLPETDDAKRRYLERQATIDRLIELAPISGPTVNGNFVVSTEAEFIAAMKNAGRGSVVALKDGTYRFKQKFVPQDSLMIVGQNGDRQKVRIIFENQDRAAFALPSGVELTLMDLSLETSGCFSVAQDARVKATRCDFRGSVTGESKIVRGDYVLTDCNVDAPEEIAETPEDGNKLLREMNQAFLDGDTTTVNSVLQRYIAAQGAQNPVHPVVQAAFGAPTGAFSSTFGSLTAENCDFTGGITCARLSLKNCAVHDCKTAITVSGGGGQWGNGEEFKIDASCEIVDCRFYQAQLGLNISRLEATARGCEFREIKTGALVWQEGALTLNDVKFVDCLLGVEAGERDSNSNSVCNATNATFVNVQEKWRLNGASRVTLDGRPVAPAADRRSYY